MEYPIDRYLTLTKLVGTRKRFAQGLEWRTAQIDLDFVCEDPFWQDVETYTEATSLSSGAYTSFYNPGSVESFPTIIISTIGSNISLTSLKNVSDNGQLFTYADLAFTDVGTLVIDGINGTVTRDSTNTVRFLTGSFVKIVSGINTLQYFGDAAQVSITYRPRYL
jgi:phage-related protein